MLIKLFDNVFIIITNDNTRIECFFNILSSCVLTFEFAFVEGESSSIVQFKDSSNFWIIIVIMVVIDECLFTILCEVLIKKRRLIISKSEIVSMYCDILLGEDEPPIEQ